MLLPSGDLGMAGCGGQIQDRAQWSPPPLSLCDFPESTLLALFCFALFDFVWSCLLGLTLLDLRQAGRELTV